MTRLEERQRAVNDLQQRVNDLSARLAEQVGVRSTFSGTVIELRVQPGSLVHQGQPLLVVEDGGAGMEVVAFVNVQDGKRVRQGMNVRIALASVRKEDSGMLLGHVESVSAFPMSFDAVRNVIENEDLARSFMQAGPPFMVRVALDKDPASVSGYKWTSHRGNAVPVSSGIPASAEIVTEWRRPLSMVMPALRDLLGT